MRILATSLNYVISKSSASIHQPYKKAMASIMEGFSKKSLNCSFTIYMVVIITLPPSRAWGQIQGNREAHFLGVFDFVGVGWLAVKTVAYMLIKTSDYSDLAIFASFDRLKTSQINLFLLAGLDVAERLSAWIRMALDALRSQLVGTSLKKI